MLRCFPHDNLTLWLRRAGACAGVVLLAGACSPQAADESPAECHPPKVFAASEQQPYFITAGASRLFWASSAGIRAVPIAGGTPATLSPIHAVRDIAVAGDDLFVADYESFTIWRIRGDTGAAEPAVHANASGLAVAGGYLYWTQPSEDNQIALGAGEGHVARMPLGGGAVEILVDHLDDPMQIAANEQAVFFESWPTGISRWTAATGTTDVVAGESPANLAAGGDGVYYVRASVFPRELVFVPNSGSARVVASGVATDAIVAVDGSGVYLSSSSGRVERLAPGASSLTSLAADLGQIGWLTLTPDAVFVTGKQEVIRVDKAPGECPSLDTTCPTPVGDPASIAATPREDEDAELLALHLDGTLVATQETYDRLVADTAVIKTLIPSVSVQYHAPYDGKSLGLRPTEEAAQAMQAGTYHAWDCLNDFYGLEATSAEYSSLIDAWFATVRLKGRYNLELLAEVYAQLPGIDEATPNWSGGDGPTTCARRSNGVYEYVVDDRTGDCPAGCTSTTAYYFTSPAQGQVQLVESWDGGVSPGWYSICQGY